MSRDLALWIGVLAGPIIWLVSFEANFALAPWACVTQGKAALYAVSILALSLSAGSGLLAWCEWGELGKESPDGEGALPRSRIMAIGGVLLSSLFFLVIPAQAIPEVMLKACN
ncbi:MAG: hypothetical protein ACR2IV_22435 [Bryobacteraceae bacterium]